MTIERTSSRQARARKAANPTKGRGRHVATGAAVQDREVFDATTGTTKRIKASKKGASADASKLVVKGLVVRKSYYSPRKSRPRLVEFLGRSLIEKDRLILGGLPASYIKEVSQMSGASQAKIMEIVGVSKSTVSDAVHTKKPLSVEDSDRLARLAEITDLAMKVLGGKEAASLWLNSPIPALRNEKPFDLLGSSAGCRLVEDTLMQIDSGAYA